MESIQLQVYQKKENSFYCDEFVPEDNIKYDYFILYPYNENVKSLVQTGDKLYTDTPITLSGETGKQNGSGIMFRRHVRPAQPCNVWYDLGRRN